MSLLLEHDDLCLNDVFPFVEPQGGQPNLLDRGVLQHAERHGLTEPLVAKWDRLDEVPFDFERRRLSVVLRDRTDADAAPLLVCKVALFDMPPFLSTPEITCNLYSDESGLQTSFFADCPPVRSRQRLC